MSAILAIYTSDTRLLQITKEANIVVGIVSWNIFFSNAVFYLWKYEIEC